MIFSSLLHCKQNLLLVLAWVLFPKPLEYVLALQSAWNILSPHGKLMIRADEIQNDVLIAHLLMHRDIDCSRAFVCQLCLVNHYASVETTSRITDLKFSLFWGPICFWDFKENPFLFCFVAVLMLVVLHHFFKNCKENTKYIQKLKYKYI